MSQPSRGRCWLRAGGRAAVVTVLTVAGALGPVSYAKADASTWYVGGAGCSDSGPGTQDQPFCTISEAASVATAGQTVLVSSGTYPENVTPHSGTSGAPITFQAAPGATAIITGATHGFTISSRSWITISGFTVTGTTSSGIYLLNSNHITVSGNTVTASGQRIQGANAVGIYVGGTSDSTLSGNHVDNNSAQGIYLTQNSTGVTVDSNEASFNAFGWERNANGIDVISPGNTIIRNVVHDNEDSGIQFYPGGNNNVVADNLSYHNMGITTVQLANCTHPTTGNTSDCFTGDHGIDDLGVTGNQITGNTVYANTTAGINVEGILPAGTPSGFTIKNNVSADNAINCPDGAGGTTTCPATKGDIRVDSTSGTGTVLDRDVMWLSGSGYLATWGNTQVRTLSAFQAASGQEPNGKQADPGFVNPSAGNFQLTAGSPAIDMADSSAAGEQTTDLAGNQRVDDPSTPNTGVGVRAFDDAGAYEYQAPPAPPVPQATANATSVTLNWSGPPPGTPPIDTYTIYRGTSPGNETQLATVSGPTTQYTDSAVTVGTAYYYQVTAQNSTGTSARSQETSAVPGGAATSPIAFRAASQAAITSGVTHATITAPAGVQPGDVMVAWLTLGNPVSGFSLSSGWTPFSWSPMVDGTAYQVFGYYKVATAADGGATYTASWTGTSKGAFTIAAYSGVDNAAPLAGSAGLVDNNSSTSLSTPSLASSAATSWAVALYSIRLTTSSNKNNSWTPDPALTERVDANNSAAASSPWAAIEVADSQGAVSTSTNSYTAQAVYAESHKAAALVYLRQAPNGVGS